MKKKSKVFLFRCALSVGIALSCFYGITEIAWPAVCKMQATYNYRKNGQKINTTAVECLKEASLKSTKKKDFQLHRVAFYESTYKRISKNQLKLLEFLEFYHKNGLLKKDVYQIFLKNVSVTDRNMPTFFKWLRDFKNWQLIRVQFGEVRLTEIGGEFLQYAREKNISYFV